MFQCMGGVIGDGIALFNYFEGCPCVAKANSSAVRQAGTVVVNRQGLLRSDGA